MYSYYEKQKKNRIKLGITTASCFSGLFLILIIFSLFNVKKDREIDELEIVNNPVIASVATDQEVFKYYYTKLNNEEKSFYIQLEQNLKEQRDTFYIESTISADISISKIFQSVLNDNPDIFYVTGYSYKVKSHKSKIYNIEFAPLYYINKEDVPAYKENVAAYCKECLKDINKYQTDYDKIKYVYEYIIKNTEYDLTSSNNQDIISVMSDGRSVCQGYAKSFQCIMNMIGYKTILVTGYLENEPHAWNIVMANDNFYHIDLTWGDTANNSNYGNDINYDCFLVDEKEIKKTHKIANIVNIPNCTHTEMNYYVHEGLYIDEMDEEKIKQIFQKAYKDKEPFVIIKCSNNVIYTKLKMELIDEEGIMQYFKGDKNDIIYLENSQLNTLKFYL